MTTATVAEILRARASSMPERMAFTFLSRTGKPQATFTYGEMDRRAASVGRLLQTNGARPGDRAILLFSPGLAYIAALAGCFYAGVIAVPACPARSMRGIPRLRSIVANAAPRFALIPGTAAGLDPGDLGDPSLRVLAVEEAVERYEKHLSMPRIVENDIALLQYTSGSTATPKGVVVTHRNLTHNLSLICSSFGLGSESRIVSWLPPYHDMGLVGVILGAVYSGGHATLLSPMDFLQRPLSWLQAISDGRATHSGGPNFAYELCVQRTTAEQRASLDLGSWRVAFNGAEPVRPETLARFADAFKIACFSSRAFAPCYGLAECTLLVSTHLHGTDPHIRNLEPDALEHNRVVEAPHGAKSKCVVGCGTPCLNVVIVDPGTGIEIPDGTVGEIWVSGLIVAAGYWSSPSESRNSFQACLSGSGDRGFLRTGDLGFMSGGELFVTGRCKDTIIICGRNIYPQDIEVTSQLSHQSVIHGAAAAFSISDEGEEHLVVVQECCDSKVGDASTIRRAIRNAIAEEHGVSVHTVELVRPGSVPRTTSGKVQRYACKAGFVAHTLNVIEETGESGSFRAIAR